MGMFDWYVPEPPLSCPKCSAALHGWQGKDGPCALFEWVQGALAPPSQLVDAEVAITESEREAFRLPPEFEIYTECDSCQMWIQASGSCEAEIWLHVGFLDPLEPPGLSDDWITLRTDDRLNTLAELRREITPGHVLYGCRMTPLARRRDRDDVLVRTLGSRSPLHIVHLTWQPGSDPAWPRTRAFRELSEIDAELRS